MDNVVRKILLIIYYVIGVRFPTQPMPGYRIGYALRRFLVSRIAEKCGRDIIVKQGCYIGAGIGLRVGDRAQLGHNAKIGRNVTIGNDVLMGPDVVIMTDSHAFEDLEIPINQQGQVETSPVIIGNDVWIGTRVIIMPGVTIGDRSVIGAGSIVTKNLPPNSVAVGNPARVIRMRGERKPKT